MGGCRPAASTSSGLEEPSSATVTGMPPASRIAIWLVVSTDSSRSAAGRGRGRVAEQRGKKQGGGFGVARELERELIKKDANN